MKLLIEIPDKTYRMIKNNKYDYGDMNIIIQNGTPLDNIRERINLEKLGYSPNSGYYKAIMEVLRIIDKYRAGSEVSDGDSN